MARFGIGARAVDLLGRQQVAGTPTALNELFKNSHDAYADNVSVDYFPLRNLLLVRDDGVGMSEFDFETRWLTAATDSKRGTHFLPPPPTDPDKKPRPVMGEKGIGRLAIAVLGPQVLVLTREKTIARDGRIVAGLVNWGMFELPNLTIDDIFVPTRVLDPCKLPTGIETAAMAEELATALEALRPKTDPERLEMVLDQVRNLKLDPASIWQELETLKSSQKVQEVGPRLHGDEGWGTQFFVTPTSDMLREDVEPANAPKEADRSTPMQKVLLGFSNTMETDEDDVSKVSGNSRLKASWNDGSEASEEDGSPEKPEPPMQASFRVHRGTGRPRELIAESVFWTQKDFTTADHVIEGAFDARGQFEGSIRIFDAPELKLVVPFAGSGGRDTRCGPFRLKIGYLQGNERDSLLKDEAFREANEKVSRIGGIYVYKDNIRILPYGDSEFDFLGFEARRLKGAGYYFFSYKRMFGYVGITRGQNGALIEKAGREGFQDNTAYKQFKRILEDFFVQVAAEFFREDGAQGQTFERISKRISEEHALLEKRRRQVVPRRKALLVELDDFFQDVGAGRSLKIAETAVRSVEDALRDAEHGDIDAATVLRLEREARSTIVECRRRVRVVRPRGLGLTRELSRLWASYEIEHPRLDARLSECLGRISAAVTEGEERLKLGVDFRRRAAERLDETANEERRSVVGLRRLIDKRADEVLENARSQALESFLELNSTIKSAMVAFETGGHAHLPEGDLETLREKLEADITSLGFRQSNRLRKIAERLEVMALPVEEADETDLLAAMEAELEEFREREAETLRLAQMGQAIGIVHHEFSAVIRGVRSNIRRLGSWAERNPRLQVIYDDIRGSYAHLDSYLGLFAPLSRRLSSTARVIGGDDIEQYVRELFGSRMTRHAIELQTTGSFRAARIEENVADIYPCFVNLIDNAIFWIEHASSVQTNHRSEPDREITLDYSDDCFIVSDTGPGIPSSDTAAIFESGFSRKPGGSGLGLHITKSLLEKNGYTISADPRSDGVGATFRIAIPDERIHREAA